MAIRISGLVSNMDTDSIVKELMSAQSLKKTKIENKKTKLEWTQDSWKALNTKIYKFYTAQVSKMRLQSSYKAKAATSSDETVATATATTTAATGSHSLQVNQLASSQYVTGKALTGVTTSTKVTDAAIGMTVGTKIKFGSGTELVVDANTTISQVVTNAKNAGLNASFDATQGRFFISAKEGGATNAFSIAATSGGVNTGEDELNLIGLSTIDTTNSTTLATTTATAKIAGVSYVAASNAEIVLDGAVLTGTSNSFSAAGITFSLKNKTASGETVSLNVSDDTKATYDMIKSFVTEYNSLLKEMNTDYYATTAKGYEPLTTDQKDAMSDTQVEQWETKIKDSLLRRDTKLGSITNALKSSMTSAVTVGDESVSLSTYGIMTSTDYTEKGLLHIYGNSDDSTYSDKTDKLMAALEADPDKVADAFSQIATNLYKSMNDKMKSTSLNSALTFYNDKEITKQLTTYTTEISDWEDKLETMETKYYKQFSAMETAMSKLNSQSSSLSSMLSSS